MIKLTVLYPNQADKPFNLDYYLNSHIPMVRSLLSPACREIIIDRGVGGAMPGTPAPYTIIVHLLFDSIDSFETAFTPHAAEIVADVPNYTATDPIIQLSEVVG